MQSPLQDKEKADADGQEADQKAAVEQAYTVDVFDLPIGLKMEADRAWRALLPSRDTEGALNTARRCIHFHGIPPASLVFIRWKVTATGPRNEEKLV
jgi:hypothetical protein